MSAPVGRGPAPLSTWLAEPLLPEVLEVLARLRRTEGVERIAVMPDVHLGGESCIGTVVATRGRILPRAVGGDIGCGIATVRFAAEADALLSDEGTIARLLAGLRLLVPPQRHSRETRPEALPAVLEESPLSHRSLETVRRRDGRVQFATLGRGNHFLELQEDDEGALWAMVHSGSRAMGTAITEHHLRACRTTPEGISYLDAEDAAGRAYLADLAWARRYAEESRLAMLRAVSILLGELAGVAPEEESLIACDHNHVLLEEHGGDSYWVHRKGALRACEGERAVIPGSMGTTSFHVEGRGEPASLRSSSHGAGRRLRRGDALRRISVKELRRQLGRVRVDPVLEESLRDEAPGAYRDIERVMRAQRELTRIVRRVRPRLCHKGV